jgi:hypothetical protein
MASGIPPILNLGIITQDMKKIKLERDGIIPPLSRTISAWKTKIRREERYE